MNGYKMYAGTVLAAALVVLRAIGMEIPDSVFEALVAAGVGLASIGLGHKLDKIKKG